MARYNTVTATSTANGATTLSAPGAGLTTTITGTAPFTVTLPNPVLYTGATQTLYNASSGSVTLSTPSGVFSGVNASGTSSITMPRYAVFMLTSDGTNYVLITSEGGSINALSVTASGGTITLNSSASTGAIDGVNIGATTRGSGAFTTLAANSTLTLSSTSATHSISSTASSSTLANNALYIAGGLGVANGIYNSGVSTVGTNTTGLGTPFYVFKNVSNITSGAQESNSAATFGKSDATGDISVFIGSDQGTNKIGWIGAVNRGTGYVPLVLNPAGGYVGIGTNTGTVNYPLHVTSSAGNPAGFYSTSSGGGNIYLACTNASSTVNGYIGPNAWINNTFSLGSSTSHAVGIVVNGTTRAQWDTSGNLIPYSDAAYNLGSTANRWNNIYTADAHFSNEGTEGNSVDGTTGNWTLQEGEDNIYMLNNKTGKRYKIKLEEV